MQRTVVSLPISPSAWLSKHPTRLSLLLGVYVQYSKRSEVQELEIHRSEGLHSARNRERLNTVIWQVWRLDYIFCNTKQLLIPGHNVSKIFLIYRNCNIIVTDIILDHNFAVEMIVEASVSNHNNYRWSLLSCLFTQCLSTQVTGGGEITIDVLLLNYTSMDCRDVITLWHHWRIPGMVWNVINILLFPKWSY